VAAELDFQRMVDFIKLAIELDRSAFICITRKVLQDILNRKMLSTNLTKLCDDSGLNYHQIWKWKNKGQRLIQLVAAG
jgi:hypothetical protein